MTIFELRDDGKYDLPLGMVATPGGTICYIRKVPHDFIRELATLTSDWHEVLYLDVQEARTKDSPTPLISHLLGEAQEMGFETLAITPLIEAGMLVYRNDQGELHPVITDNPKRDVGMVVGHVNGDPIVRLIGPMPEGYGVGRIVNNRGEKYVWPTEEVESDESPDP